MRGLLKRSIFDALAPFRRLASETQFINTRQLTDHVPLGLEFDFMQLAGQPAPGEREAWNADALMEGVRVGSRRAEFLAALEDRVKTEEAQWSPLLQLHHPDKLDACLVAFGGAQRVTGAGPHHDEQGGLAFLETGTLRC